MEQKSVSVIISKKNWQELLEGRARAVIVYKESELRYLFGDYPEERIIRVEIIQKES